MVAIDEQSDCRTVRRLGVERLLKIGPGNCLVYRNCRADRTQHKQYRKEAKQLAIGQLHPQNQHGQRHKRAKHRVAGQLGRNAERPPSLSDSRPCVDPGQQSMPRQSAPPSWRKRNQMEHCKRDRGQCEADKKAMRSDMFDTQSPQPEAKHHDRDGAQRDQRRNVTARTAAQHKCRGQEQACRNKFRARP